MQTSRRFVCCFQHLGIFREHKPINIHKHIMSFPSFFHATKQKSLPLFHHYPPFPLPPPKKRQAFVHIFGKTWSQPTLPPLKVLALRRELQRVAELMQVPPLVNKNQSKESLKSWKMFDKVNVWGKFGFNTCKYMHKMGHCFIFSVYPVDIFRYFRNNTNNFLSSCSCFVLKRSFGPGNHPGPKKNTGHISQFNPEEVYRKQSHTSRATCNENVSSTSLGNDGLMVTCCNLHFLSDTKQKKIRGPWAFADLERVQVKRWGN